MANSFFRFKQFTVYQDRTVMKVCTDSCLLGAWTALRIKQAKNILDIGTGTGLLPLFLAQSSEALIDTIESDPAAATQAAENISDSPWPDRIRVFHGDARRYAYPLVYDFIIANPPFYASDLRSPDPEKNIAKHAESLTLEELLQIILSNLKSGGAFSILLPFPRSDYFEKIARAKGFYPLEKLIVRQTPKHSPFRMILLFGVEEPASLLSPEITIRGENGAYSAEFSSLMREYYLER